MQISQEPKSAKEISRLIKAMAPASAATLRRIRNAYASYSDIAVITLCREQAEVLAGELTGLLHVPVTGQQLRNLCIDMERWAERQAWERLIADIAILLAVSEDDIISQHSGSNTDANTESDETTQIDEDSSEDKEDLDSDPFLNADSD